MLRTHTCGELRKQDVGKEVVLCGWIHSKRDHGGVIFVDLRDRYGITQCVFDPNISKENFNIIDKLKNESVIQIKGEVAKRAKGMENPKIATGEIEVKVKELKVLTKSKDIPFEINVYNEKEDRINEELRLKYRYLDLRKERMKQNIIFRHKLIKFIRDFLDKKGFLEIETPILTKSTPEGARDFIVPSRIHPGKFYALPQSPQQYKQLAMIAGLDRYFQIARCFRDEDQRGDRQPEFTQLDIEMSFVEREDILNLVEELMIQMVKKFLPNKKLKFSSFPRLKYKDVIKDYGSDKPDLRFDLKIQDVTDIFQNTEFKIFKNEIEKEGVIRVINAKKSSDILSRQVIDELTEFAKELGALGLAWVKVKSEKELISPIVKFFSEKEKNALIKRVKAEPGDLIFFSAGKEKKVREILGELRLEIGRRLNLIDKNELAFAFIVDFPLFEEELENGHFAPSHHMFTKPKEEDIPLLDKDPFKVRSCQYDLVCNGIEIGGGSIRIHNPELQEKIFKLIGFTKEDIKKFQHILEAFQYGAPPHGGIAIGLDRLIMIFRNEPSIREVIPFPKNQKAMDLMMGAPSEVEENQLKEVHINIINDEE